MQFKKRTLIFSIALLLLGIAAGITYSHTQKIKPLVEAELKAFIMKSTQDLYQVEFDKLSFNLWTGSASISGLRFYPDSAVYAQQIQTQTAPNNLYVIELEKLSIERFRPWNMYFKQEALIKRIVFDKPKVQMINKQFAFNDSVPPQPRQSPYAFISKFFKRLHIEEIEFKQARVLYVNNNYTRPEVDSISNLQVKLKDWLIDEHSAQDPSRIYLVKDVEISLDNYSYYSPDSLYHLKLSQLDFALKAGKLHIQEISLNPRYTAYDFGKKSGYARDRFLVQLQDLQVSGIDLPAYISRQQFLAKQILIKDGLVEVQNDNRFPKRKMNRAGRFPHQLLQNLQAKIGVDSMQLNNVHVRYLEYDKDSQQSGKISFENTKASLVHVGNLDKSKSMEAQLETYVMGQGKLVAEFVFDRYDPKGGFTYQGKLTNLDGKTLNQLTKPLGMLQINRGEIDELAFAIQANSDRALGTVDFKYHNLSVALMKKKVGKERLVRQGVLSFLANNLVLENENPRLNGAYAQAKINYRRLPEASFFSYIWKTLFQGVKFSVGLSPAKEREILRHINRFEQYKEDREDRKQKREIRRSKRP